ncbi:MAG: hypothetical protein EBZ48_05555 [Proteobacteria bacterium]|nr:hypothetical protein [Pseudomonadota bacterium]
MSVWEDLEKLTEEGAKAYDLIEAGKFNSAQRILSRVKRSWYVSDAMRIAVPLEGLMLYRRRKKNRALELLQENIAYLWADTFALELMRACLGKVPSAHTRLYRMKIKGGEPVLGMFTYFGPEYITTVEVFADDEFEAFSFLDALLRFTTPDARRLLEFTEIDFPADFEPDLKGIYYTHPFRPDSASDDLPSDADSVDSSALTEQLPKLLKF